jgi:hypothetical protein
MAKNDLAYERRRPRERGLRASDRDREAVSAILRQEHVAGRLTPDEFHERLDRCLQAKTYSELDALIADLPADEPNPRAWSLLPVPLVLVPLAIIAALALSVGHVGWIVVPLVFFFVVRPLMWRARARRGGWGMIGWGGYRGSARYPSP